MHTHKSLIVGCPFWVEGGSGFVALSGYYGNIGSRGKRPYGNKLACLSLLIRVLNIAGLYFGRVLCVHAMERKVFITLAHVHIVHKTDIAEEL